MEANENAVEASEVDDDVVIDLTDATMAREALYRRLVSTSPTGELVIDLRDQVLDKLLDIAPTGRASAPSELASGRPQTLEEGLRLVTIDDSSQNGSSSTKSMRWKRPIGRS